MYVGTQFKARHETDIRQLAQLGVEHVDVTPTEHWTEWTVDLLASIREKYAKYGIAVESMHSPLSSRAAFNSGMPHMFLGPSDERERELDGFCEIIRMTSEAGLRALLYNVTILGHLRTGPRLRERRRNRVVLQIRRPRPDPAGVRGRCGGRGHYVGAHRLLPGASRSRGETSTRCSWLATRRTRASRTTSTGAWRVSWARLTESRGS